MKRIFVSIVLAATVSSAFATNKPSKPAKPSKPPVSQPSKPTPQNQAQGQAQIQGQAQALVNHSPVSVTATTPVNVSTPVTVEATQPANVTNTTSVGLSSSPFQNSTVNINEAVHPTKTEVKVRNTGDAVGYAAPPSAVCALTGGAGMALPGFGASVSGSSIDKGCEARENARMLIEIGAERAALRVLCRHSEDVAAEIDICEDIVKLHDEKKRRSTAPASNFGIVN